MEFLNVPPTWDWFLLYFRILASQGMLSITQKKVEVIELKATWLGKNKIYQLTRDILNTAFATAIPVILLFYLNMSTVIGE